VDDVIAEITESGGNGLDKLRKLICGYGEIMATDFGASLVRFDVRDLAEKNQRIVRNAKRSIDRTFRSYISDGIADGSIAPCDPNLTAFAIAGSLNWIGHWYRPGGALSAEAVAADFATRLTEGLINKQTKKKASTTPPRPRQQGGRSR